MQGRQHDVCERSKTCIVWLEFKEEFEGTKLDMILYTIMHGTEKWFTAKHFSSHQV